MDGDDEVQGSMFDPRFADREVYPGGPKVSEAVAQVIEAEKVQLVGLLRDLGPAGAEAVRDYMAHISTGIAIDAGKVDDQDAVVAASVAMGNFHRIVCHPDEVRAEHPEDPDWAQKYVVGWVTAASTMQRRFMAMSAAQTTVMGAMMRAAPEEYERSLFRKALGAAQQILAEMRGSLLPRSDGAPPVPTVAVQTARAMVGKMWSDQAMALAMALDAAEAEVAGEDG